MRITIQIVDSDVPLENDLIPLDVFPDMTLADVKALIEGDTSIPSAAQHIFLNNRVIADSSQTLEALQVKDGDMLGLTMRDPSALGQRQPQNQEAARGSQRARQGPDPESVRLQILGDRTLRAQVRETAPELADAAEDRQRFHDLFNENQRRLAQSQAEKEARIAVLNADPFNAEAQKEIEEMIRLERVQENVQEALENNPESFGRVTMLYVPVLVNNHPVKAFVDCGAQMTVMSPSCAERTNIMRLIDRRFSGMAKGVGTANIIGRVHVAELQIGSYSLPSSFTVMEGKDVDLLLGLDMLKRHQMEINLKENCLKVHNDSIPFLPESEIPKGFEEEMIEGPGGTKIGTRTGVIEPPSNTSTPVPDTSSTAPNRTGPATSSSPLGQPAAPQQSAIPSPPPQSRVSPEAINKITELGFSREEAIQALIQVNGDVELAIGLLI